MGIMVSIDRAKAAHSRQIVDCGTGKILYVGLIVSCDSCEGTGRAELCMEGTRHVCPAGSGPHSCITSCVLKRCLAMCQNEPISSDCGVERDPSERQVVFCSVSFTADINGF